MSIFLRIFGIIVLVFGLFIMVISTIFLGVLGFQKSNVGALALAALPILLIGWLFGQLWRLIRNHPQAGGGLFSPTALRITAAFCFLMPIGGLITGYYREHGMIVVFQAVMYWMGAFGLLRLARGRDYAVHVKKRSGQVTRSRQEVAEIIRRFLANEGGDWDWDDFISIPIADKQLDDIRQRCASLPEQFPADPKTRTYCGPDGECAMKSMVDELAT